MLKINEEKSYGQSDIKGKFNYKYNISLFTLIAVSFSSINGAHLYSLALIFVNK